MSDYQLLTILAVARAHSAVIRRELLYDGFREIKDEPPFEMDPLFEDPAEVWLINEWDLTGGDPFFMEMTCPEEGTI